MLGNIPQLMTTDSTRRPDPAVREQRVAFGMSGHRGSAIDGAFNETPILAIPQAIRLYQAATSG
jgi:phosphoglucomutase